MIWYKELWVLNEVVIVWKGNNYRIAVTQNVLKIHFLNVSKDRAMFLLKNSYLNEKSGR